MSDHPRPAPAPTRPLSRRAALHAAARVAAGLAAGLAGVTLVAEGATTPLATRAPAGELGDVAPRGRGEAFEEAFDAVKELYHRWVGPEEEDPEAELLAIGDAIIALRQLARSVQPDELTPLGVAVLQEVTRAP